jgi:SAM-dependent methyltransferase
VTPRVDFSGNAPIYDRRHGTLLPPHIVQALASAGALEPGKLVLDVGAGTGRAAIAIADFGCRVLAVEPAIPMLKELRTKAAARRLWIVGGDGQQLPCGSGRFDVVILARVLYVISDWRLLLRQVYGVLKSGGHLLHEWGNGVEDEPWVQIREKARALFQESGVEQPFHPGARTEADVDAYLMHLGFVRTAEVPSDPGPRLTLRDFVERIVSGEFSYTWNVPKRIQEQCLPLLRTWCEQTFDLDEAFTMPRELQWSIYQKA